MKHTREETETVKRVHSNYTCDLCGVDVETSKDFYDHAEATCRTRKAELECESGTIFPEGSNVEGQVLDVCHGCFTTKIIPLIESTFGVKFRTEDRGW